MGGTVLIINANSNPDVTAGFEEAVGPLLTVGSPKVIYRTLEGAPFGITTQEHVEAVTIPLRSVVVDRHDADAFVIACFSDPGLAVCREATKAAVFGIRECAVFNALSLADTFGVVALGPSSIKRQTRAFREMGVSSRWAGSEPLHMSVEAAEEPSAFPAIEKAGEQLLERGAESVILGCAGMVRHRAPLAARLGVPVIDPVQAAAVQAIGHAMLAAANRANGASLRAMADAAAPPS
ncbi:MAG: aspartate/glutamate racemase family protein [Pseudomonadota bacterium]